MNDISSEWNVLKRIMDIFVALGRMKNKNRIKESEGRGWRMKKIIKVTQQKANYYPKHIINTVFMREYFILQDRLLIYSS